MRRLIQDGDSVYMIDEECMKKKEEQERRKEMQWQRQNAKEEKQISERKQT